MLAPGLEETSFFGWWERITSKVDGDIGKGLNSLVILGACRSGKPETIVFFMALPLL
jgi:hypothetical protein